MSTYINTIDVTNNPSTRVPVCLCLDLSGSMGTIEGGDFCSTGRYEIIDGNEYEIVEGGTSRLDELQKGIEMLFDAIREDEMAIDAAEIAIVGFDDSARCILDFNHIENQHLPRLQATGNTAMGEGVNLALKLLEDRKAFYRSKGIQYYQPWLVLMTDGENNGSPIELNSAIEKTVSLINERKLTIFPIGIGDEADMETLKKFSPNRAPMKLQGLKFKEFFLWLSQSISRTSVSKPGEKVSLPDPGGWGTL